jgi:hypothetical protein
MRKIKRNHRIKEDTSYRSAFQIKGLLGFALQSLHFWVLLGRDTHNPSKYQWILILFFSETQNYCFFVIKTLSNGFLQYRSRPTLTRVCHNKLHYQSCIQHCCLHHYKMDHLDKIQQNMVNLEYPI